VARELQDAANTLYNRGPDDSGVWVSENVGLGHRRLAGDYSATSRLVKAAPPNAEFLGGLNWGQLVEFYRGARVLVIPSRCFEPFANVTIEAMGCGLPVIASKIG
jgi:glycosyltransferase involved in cell wall biosynthesis